MVNVKIGESLLKVLFCVKILHFQAGNYELCQIDEPRIIGVNDSHEQVDLAWIDGGSLLQSAPKLILADNSVIILVQFFKNGDKNLFVF